VDWPRARAILLAAFAVVNLILAYSIWGTGSVFVGPAVASRQTAQQLRESLLERGLVLPITVTVPRTPNPMRFLYVEAPLTPDSLEWAGEFYGTTPFQRAEIATPSHLRLMVNPETHATELWANATGPAAREVQLDNEELVRKAAEDYLRQIAFMPPGARFSAIYPAGEDRLVAEFVPFFEGVPVYSGYVRVEVSARGIEKVTRLWVVPRYYTDAPPKDVRPASEALLRLAGRLSSTEMLTVKEIQVGYYAGRAFSLAHPDDVHGWDTVPVWRITLDDGQIFYVNAFNGEWES